MLDARERRDSQALRRRLVLVPRRPRRQSRDRPVHEHERRTSARASRARYPSSRLGRSGNFGRKAFPSPMTFATSQRRWRPRSRSRWVVPSSARQGACLVDSSNTPRVIRWRTLACTHASRCSVAGWRRSCSFRSPPVCRRRSRRRARRSRKRRTCASAEHQEQGRRALHDRQLELDGSDAARAARALRRVLPGVHASRGDGAPTPTCTSASSPPTTARATRPGGGCDASPRRAARHPADAAVAEGDQSADRLHAADAARRTSPTRSAPAARRRNLPNGTDADRAGQRVHLHGVGRRRRLRLRASARVGLRGAAQHRRERGLLALRRAPRRRLRDQRGRRLGAADGEVLREQTATIRPAAARTASTRAIARRASPSSAAACRIPYGMPIGRTSWTARPTPNPMDDPTSTRPTTSRATSASSSCRRRRAA